MSNTKISLAITVVLALFATGGAVQGRQRPDYLFRFIQISDSQPRSEEVWQTIENAVELINDLDPAFVLFAGDLTDAGTQEDFKRIKKIIIQIKSPVYTIPGNHDLRSRANQEEKELPFKKLYGKKLALYESFFGDSNWSFEYGDFLFVGFNSCSPEYAFYGTSLPEWPNLCIDQMKWLDSTFKSSPKPYKVLVTHYPVDMSISFEESVHEITDFSGQNIVNIIRSNKVLMSLYGHTHTHAPSDTDPEHGYLRFSSVHMPEGLLYFDVYSEYILAFWRPIKCPTRPLGIYNLKERYKTLPQSAEK